MWLLLDIGNSRIKGGFFDNGMMTRSFRMESNPRASVPAYRHSINHHVLPTTPDRVGIVSVVPEVTALLVEAIQHELMVLPENLRSDMVLPIKMGYRTPGTLGVDRLAAACAAHKFFSKDDKGEQRSVVIVDAGTAVTIDAVDAKGVYRGGAIAPGPTVLRAALSRGTSQLADVSMQLPKRPIGRTTTEAIQSGLLWGFIDGVAGLIERIKRQLKRKPYVVATGGWAELLMTHIEAIDKIEEELVLYGGRLMLELNPPNRQSGAV